MKKSIVVLELVLAILLFLVACVKEDSIVKYNATLYDEVMEWMYPDYIEENATLGTGNSGVSLPRTVTRLITTQEDYEKAFSVFPVSINFENEMLIVYFFNGDGIVYRDGEKIFVYSLKNIKVNEKNVRVVIEKETLVSGPTGLPLTQMCLVIKMNKTDVREVNIELIFSRKFLRGK